MYIERRNINKDMHSFWDDLNLAQKFAVAELQRFGYDLFCVRHNADSNIALLKLDRHIAAIDYEGKINTEPSIKVRF